MVLLYEREKGMVLGERPALFYGCDMILGFEWCVVFLDLLAGHGRGNDKKNGVRVYCNNDKATIVTLLASIGNRLA